jgi:hypothetical protein
MNIYLALLLFSFIILLYWVITELFTFFFRLTGLPAERARFQVLSLLTGTGFTTRESEMILSSRRRRRLARITMLFGYVFNITIVTAFINVFLTMKLSQVGYHFLSFLIPLGTAALIFIFMRVPKIHAIGDTLLRRLADRAFERKEAFNAVMLIDNISSESIAQVTLRHIPEEYQGLSLAETRLRAETGILVMLVERPGSKAEPAGPDTVFAVGDNLTVFGDYASICRTFHAKESFDELLAQQA